MKDYFNLIHLIMFFLKARRSQTPLQTLVDIKILGFWREDATMQLKKLKGGILHIKRWFIWMTNLYKHGCKKSIYDQRSIVLVGSFVHSVGQTMSIQNDYIVHTSSGTISVRNNKCPFFFLDPFFWLEKTGHLLFRSRYSNILKWNFVLFQSST